VEVSFKQSSALIVMISDGAGSAKYSSTGSRIVVKVFGRHLAHFVQSSVASEVITVDMARDWLDDVRDRIFAISDAKGVKPRQFAATLVAAVIFPNHINVFHVGDGSCVVLRKGGEEWEVTSWPAHGEYASSTYFVTDDPEPQLRLCSWAGEFTDIAIFSDGLERLALDFLNKNAFSKFFNSISAPLAGLSPGRARRLSTHLRNFLDSPQVIDRTDDDKSLIVAKRVVIQ
jgi:Protein phosphatase 2C